MTAAQTATKTTPDDLTVTPRDIHFATEAASGKAWLGGDPVATAVFNAMSLTFPDGERLFMDAVRHYRSELSGKLLEDAKAFIKQEAIHSREHVALNGGLDRTHYPIDAIETEIRSRIKATRERGPMAMLGVTIALEHFTAMMADVTLEDGSVFEGTDEDILRLWQWHALEETEHKAVAFDVFQQVTQDWTPRQRYFLRIRVMALVTILFTSNISRYASRLLIADGVSPWTARARVLWYLLFRPGLFRKGWRSYWAWYKPGFHPWDHDNRATIAAWQGKFAVMAE
jgi:predicted metal-dependent hydrolase